MKNIFTAFILAVALAGISYAQAPTKGVKTAVVEFTPGQNASVMSDQAKRQLQTTLSASLNHTRKFDVYDTRHTRTATQESLATINGTSTASAIKAGKQLGVAYIVTGIVHEYITKAGDGRGSAAVTVRVIEVKTGKVVYSGEVTVRSGRPLRTGSPVEMQAEVMRHVVDQFTELIAARF